MNLSKAILFYATFFSLYAAINLYVFFGLKRALLPQWGTSRVFTVLFVLVATSFVLGRTIENYWISPLSSVLIWIGSFWFAAMLYLSVGFLGLDLLRMGCNLLGGSGLVLKTEKIVRQAVFFITCVLILTGYLNGLSPRLKTLEISLQGTGQDTRTFEILVASDIHLGTIVREKRIEHLIRAVEELQPDLVLFPGDVLDEDPQTVMDDSVGNLLRSIKAKYGVFAITGNHEYIGGVERACRYLEEHGIKLLRDQAVLVEGLFYIVGREDRSISRFTQEKRKSLQELLAPLDRRLPVILMDHQPFELQEASSAGVALQLSGHTHHGQLWPLNLITSLIYELSWGYLKKGETHFYVSSGYGTWGPPVRIGNHPEMLLLRLTLKARP
ncbi:MAG: metallophosphoesterase [bacterium]